uniref:Exonuclease domain-containing protein n=1 Tax=Rhabditophanes sp. KR3021 TaxID=114890 RepID=A0AC35TMZ1_9BILA
MTNAYEIQNYPQLDDEVLALRGQQLKPFLLLTNNQMLTLNYFLPGQNCNSFIIPTRDVYDKVNSNSPLFAIDCEMVHTENNPQALARVALISETGQVILDTLVKPEAKVINYLTQYSGIEPGMLDQVHVTLQHVQQFLIKFLPPDAILVGHTVNCDLDALGLYHPYVADVSALYNNTGKIGQRKSLVYLAQNYLGINCQSGNAHCPFEDAYVALLLFKEKMTHGIAHGNYFYSSRLAAVETTDEVEHQEEVSVGNNALSLENEASDEPAVKRRCEASVKVEKIYSICKNCQALIGVPCILKDCICLSSKVELCVKCFIDWRQIPAANECDNNGSWRDITRIDVGKAKTRKLSECLELKQNTKLGHRVMFAGRQFKDIVATSKYIHFLEREKLKSESEILDTLRYQTFDFSSMAISLDIREDVDIESFNLSLQWLIDGVMKNGLLVCVLDSPKAKCLYLKSK